MSTTPNHETISAAEIRGMTNLAQAIVRTQVLVGSRAQLTNPLAIYTALTDLLAQSEEETYTGRKDRARLIAMIDELSFEMQEQVARVYGPASIRSYNLG